LTGPFARSIPPRPLSCGATSCGCAGAATRRAGPRCDRAARGFALSLLDHLHRVLVGQR